VPALTLRSSTSNRARRGVKARRRTELGLMVAAGGIIVAAYVLMILGNTSRVPTDLAPLLISILLLGGVTTSPTGSSYPTPTQWSCPSSSC